MIQFAGSLAAIAALAFIALKLGLGGDRRIRDEEDLRELAEEALCGFDPVEVAIDRAGLAAIARDAGGRIMLLRRHGAHFAARLLSPPVRNRLDGAALVVESGERLFGPVRLDLGDDARTWAARLQQL
nr:hypothetical protein [Tsuneonella aeria]